MKDFYFVAYKSVQGSESKNEKQLREKLGAGCVFIADGFCFIQYGGNAHNLKNELEI